jgi:formylglycine-generating enzyme required for sulfatase activity
MNKPTHTIEHHTIKLSDSVSMRFCRIPACPEGFLMGSRGYDAEEEPVHRVVIEDDFWMAETPVTQEQFDLWPRAAERGDEHWPEDHPKHPANNLSWNDAIEYCGWLTESFRKHFPNGLYVASLPTEARWEYACRLMIDSRGNSYVVESEHYTGDGEMALKAAGWFGEDWSSSSTHAVGQLKATDFGLYDMHGNVWEWCLDRWDRSAYQRRWDGVTDRETFQLAEEYGDSANRVFRGGGSGDSAGLCRAAYRFGRGPGDWVRVWDQGFRVCLFSGPVPSQTAETGAESEPGSEDGARRQAAAKSQEPGGDTAEVDLGKATFPERSDGTKF